MNTTREVRNQYVTKILANFVQAGMFPRSQDIALLVRYIEGKASLADLIEQGSDYLSTALEQEIANPESDAVACSSKTITDEECAKNAAANFGLSREQRKRQKAVDAARASLSLSGFTVSYDEEREAARFVAGEIDAGQYFAHRA